MPRKPRIVGWTIQEYTDEFPTIGTVRTREATEFGNSPVRDKEARLAHIALLVKAGVDFSVTPIWRE